MRRERPDGSALREETWGKLYDSEGLEDEVRVYETIDEILCPQCEKGK
jgi:hypothetical protein